MAEKELPKVISLGGETYNAVWLRTVSEHEAIRAHHGKDHNQVRNAWKQANGKSVRNYSLEEGKEDGKKPGGKKANSGKKAAPKDQEEK